MPLTDPIVNGQHVAAKIGVTGRLTVTHVSGRIVKGGLTRYEILALDERSDHRRACHATRLFSTLNSWRASLCERAWKQGKPIDARWIETAYGDELIDVSEAD